LYYTNEFGAVIFGNTVTKIGKAGGNLANNGSSAAFYGGFSDLIYSSTQRFCIVSGRDVPIDPDMFFINLLCTFDSVVTTNDTSTSEHTFFFK
jgi:hypothetical protein